MAYDVEKKVKETIKEFNLIDKKDKVVVALSGGKDSVSIMYILHNLGYNVAALFIDLHLGDWSALNRKNMEKFCGELGIELVVVDLKKEFGQGICFIKSIVKKKKNLTGCSVCGVIKRWILNKWAKKMKADKLVTGHNLDDETQTVLMNFLKGNLFLSVNSTPKVGETSKEGFVQRVKPLFFTPEEEVLNYSKKMSFPVVYEKCPCAFGTYRVDTRNWFKEIGLNSKEKEKIVKNFQKEIFKLRKSYSAELKKCKVCGEPSRGEVCNACGMFECLK